MPSSVYVVVAGLQLLAAGVFLWVGAENPRFIWFALWAAVSALIPILLESCT